MLFALARSVLGRAAGEMDFIRTSLHIRSPLKASLWAAIEIVAECC